TVVVNEEHLGEMARFTGNRDTATVASAPHGGGVPYFRPEGELMMGWDILETISLNPPPSDGTGILVISTMGGPVYSIYPAGSDTAVVTFSGNWSFPLPPNTYEIRDNMQAVVGIASVQAGMQTNIRIDMGSLLVVDYGAAGYIVYPA
ncbi:MAG TPA: hypothetical protein PLZ51_25860, partial [Aggregatilineales bacterium]|nr:hypothetical protein [Aggregatilineales bacterium]